MIPISSISENFSRCTHQSAGAVCPKKKPSGDQEIPAWQVCAYENVFKFTYAYF